MINPKVPGRENLKFTWKEYDEYMQYVVCIEYKSRICTDIYFISFCET